MDSHNIVIWLGALPCSSNLFIWIITAYKNYGVNRFFILADGEILRPPKMSYFCPVVQTIGERGTNTFFSISFVVKNNQQVPGPIGNFVILLVIATTIHRVQGVPKKASSKTCEFSLKKIPLRRIFNLFFLHHFCVWSLILISPHRNSCS
jgi:hypothetical protein